MNSTMYTVIAQLENDFSKEQPECTLGNLMADAMYTIAGKKYGVTPDIAYVNYGGIRLPVVKAGLITRGRFMNYLRLIIFYCW